MDKRQFVRDLIQFVKREERSLSGHYTSYDRAAGVIADHIDLKMNTVKIWASKDPRDIPDKYIPQLQTFCRSRYGKAFR